MTQAVYLQRLLVRKVEYQKCVRVNTSSDWSWLIDSITLEYGVTKGATCMPLAKAIRSQQGEARIAWLDHLCGLGPAPTDHTEKTWATERAEHLDSLIGIGIAELDADWVRAFRWVGAPLCTGVDGGVLMRMARNRDGVVPTHDEAGIILPSADDMIACTGVDLKPLRQFLATHFQIRLQTAPGVACYLMDSGVLLINGWELVVGGFLHGPSKGQRHCLSIPGGGEQWLSW